MKIVFEQQQAEWLNLCVKRLCHVARTEPDTLRTCKKMAYKFEGAPRHVFLSGKERKLLLEVAKYRADTLSTQEPTDETKVVTGIVEVLSAVA